MSYSRKNPKWIKNLNINSKIMKVLEGIWEILPSLCVGKLCDLKFQKPHTHTHTPINSATNREHMHIKSQKTNDKLWKCICSTYHRESAHLPDIETALRNWKKKNNPMEKWIKDMKRKLTEKEIQVVLKQMKSCNKKG